MAFNNFPYTDAHELNLDWIIKKQKATAIEAEEALKTANEAERKVDNFLENLDLQDEVDTKIDEMYEDGDFNDIFQRYQKLTGDVIIVTASFGKTEPYTGSDIIEPFTVKCKNRIEGWNSARKCYWNAIGTKGWHNNGFLEVLQGLENTVTEPNNVSVIMVAGGGNDVSIPPNVLPSRPDGVEITRSDISDGMDAFVSYAHQHYPNAIIRFAWLSWMRTYQQYRSYAAMNEVIQWMKEICPRHGIEYCLNSEYIYHQYYQDWYLADNYHPSSWGSVYIADGIIDCIIDGCTTVNRDEFIETGFVTSKEAYADNPVQNMHPVTIRQRNDITTITINHRPGQYAFKREHGIGFFISSEDYITPAYMDIHSNLVHSTFTMEDVINFPVYIMAVGKDGDTITRRDMFNGSGYIRSSSLVVACVRSDLYDGGTTQNPNYHEDWFYIPGTIVIPTAYA